ncbi:unnamed protein product [Prunus armeniaca]
MVMAAADSQFHVLAVDDSLIDRKLIERLLKTSSYQGTSFLGLLLLTTHPNSTKKKKKGKTKGANLNASFNLGSHCFIMLSLWCDFYSPLFFIAVTTVDSGSKALEFLGLYEDDQSSPDSPSVSPSNQQEVGVNLVITDYCMPGMTGYDLLKKIKESSSLRNIPVVIMSSENVPSRINRCLEEGAEEFFLKPVRLSDLSRLRPHIMKTKSKDQNQGKEENEEKQEESSESSEASQEQDQQVVDQHQQQQPPPVPANSNKRKAMEEGLSPDRTRPRYNGITTVV